MFLAKNIFSGDIPVAGSAGLVLGKWRQLENLLHPLRFPDGEIEALIGTGATSGLCPLQPLLAAVLLLLNLEIQPLLPS